jgi:hypothetical protein
MNQAQQGLAFRAEVKKIQTETGLSYDMAFQTALATRTGTMQHPAIFGNEINDPVGAAQRRDKIQALITKWLEDRGLDRKTHYQAAFAAVARDNESLFISQQPRRSPATQWSTNRNTGVTPPSPYRPHTKDGQPDVSTLETNPRVKYLQK